MTISRRKLYLITSLIFFCILLTSGQDNFLPLLLL